MIVCFFWLNCATCSQIYLLLASHKFGTAASDLPSIFFSFTVEIIGLGHDIYYIKNLNLTNVFSFIFLCNFQSSALLISERIVMLPYSYSFCKCLIFGNSTVQAMLEQQ